MKVCVVPTIAVLFLTCIVAAINISAATRVVTKTADTNDEVCDADCSLREAVTGSQSGDIIVFSGLFNSPQTITLTDGEMRIAWDLTINGPGTYYLAVSGNNAGRILRISGGVTVSLIGMNLRDGRVGAFIGESVGGAIRLDGNNNTLNLTDMEFMNNYAFNTQLQEGYGGAVGTIDGGTINMDRVYMHNNTATDGAAVRGGRPGNLYIKNSIISDNTGEAVTSDSAVSVRDSTFSGNSGTGVAGAQLTLTNSLVKGNGTGVGSGGVSPSINIDNCLIEDNGAGFSGERGAGVINGAPGVIRNTIIRNNKRPGGTSSGGGIATTITLYVINSSIIQNKAANGGGIRNSTQHLFVTNSTISGNSAMGGTNPGLGGGIYSQVNVGGPNGRITITNSTITNNVSSGKGGGVYHESTNEARIRNSIIAKNNSILTAEKDISGVFISEGVNLIGNTTGSSGWTTRDLLNIDPLLAPLGNNGNGAYTHALLPGSPAINAGDNAFAVDPFTMLVLTIDQRGLERFVGVVDIGAHEANYSSLPVIISGRITTANGRGISMAKVRIDDASGFVFSTQTNPFGYYRLPALMSGATYTITVSHKRYTFVSPQAFTADQNRDDLNFTGGF